MNAATALPMLLVLWDIEPFTKAWYVYDTVNHAAGRITRNVIDTVWLRDVIAIHLLGGFDDL